MAKGNAQTGGLKGLLKLNGIALKAMVGALPEERLSPRMVELDVASPQPLDGDSRVDYSRVISELSRLQGLEYRYIEDLAAAATDALLARWPGRRWTVTVHKASPPADLRLRRASYTLSRGPVH